MALLGEIELVCIQSRAEEIMKAIGYIQPTEANFSAGLQVFELPAPAIGPLDLLVKIKAVSVNPVDYKVRSSRAGSRDMPVILGWDAAGVVVAIGDDVRGFRVGDEVFYAGDLTRQGSNAELQAVDHRLVSNKPKGLTFAEAAALPLTSLTAYEMLFEQLRVPKNEPFDLLVIGGAGGVGSIAIQLIKALTQEGRVFATSGSDASNNWLRDIGVSGVIDRRQPLAKGMEAFGLKEFDYIFSTTHTLDYITQLPDILRPFGGFGLIDDPQTLDIVPFKRKAALIAWEFMFAKSMFGFHPETQGKILGIVADLIDRKKIKSTANTTLKGLTAENVQEAHRRLASHTSIGKIVISIEE